LDFEKFSKTVNFISFAKIRKFHKITTRFMEKIHGKKIFFFSAQATASVHFQTTRHKKKDARTRVHPYISEQYLLKPQQLPPALPCDPSCSW
jgi:hypothetical protein